MAGHSLKPNLSPQERRRLVTFAIGLAVYAIAGLVRSVPGAVELVYARAIGPVIVWVLSSITGVFPFSLAEWVYPGYALILGWAAWRSVRAVRVGRLGIAAMARSGATRLARDVGVILIGFYALWGFNYSRAPMAERLGWGTWEGVELDEASRVARELLEWGNALYVAIHGSEDAGHPTELPWDRRELNDRLLAGWQIAVPRLGLPKSMAWRYGPVKTFLFDPVVARLGLSGLFFPFTGEANVRGTLPAVALAQSMAHEQAHQRGIGVEAEATFLGFVAAMATNDPYVRYSAVISAQSQLMNGIARRSRDRYEALDALRVPGVQRDREDLRAHYARFRGVGTRVGDAVNDRFLRANRVEGGIVNYGLAGRLLIQYARERGGVLLDTAPPTPPIP